MVGMENGTINNHYNQDKLWGNFKIYRIFN